MDWTVWGVLPLETENATLIKKVVDFFGENRSIPRRFSGGNGCRSDMEYLFADLSFLVDTVALPEHQHNKSEEEHAYKEERGEGESQLNFEGMHDLLF